MALPGLYWLHFCSSWLVDNKLSLYLGKTESVLFGSKRKLKKVKWFHIVCNGHTTESTDHVKYLGLNIDSSLSDETIVNNFIGKVNSRLKFLYRHKDCLSMSTMKTLSSALILCRFDYSCSAWYSGLNILLKSKLQVTQNKVIRFINQLGPRERITNEMPSELNLVNVDTRVKQLKLNHVHKIVNNKCPAYMKENFVNVRLFINIRQDLVNIILLFQIVRVQKVIHFTTVQLKIGIVCQKN